MTIGSTNTYDSATLANECREISSEQPTKINFENQKICTKSRADGKFVDQILIHNIFVRCLGADRLLSMECPLLCQTVLLIRSAKI